MRGIDEDGVVEIQHLMPGPQVGSGRTADMVGDRLDHALATVPAVYASAIKLISGSPV